MKINDYKDTYKRYSKLASDRIRVAAFAGIAIVWLFKDVDAQGAVHIGVNLLWPLSMFVASVISDLLQYLLGYIIWFFTFRKHEKSIDDKNHDQELNHSSFLALPIHLFFALKVIFIGVGYTLLLKHISIWF